MNESLHFREWILHEGGRWEAFKHALKTGANAYSKKRKDQKKKTEKSDLLKKLMHSKNKTEEDSAIDSIVNKGYTLSTSGELQDRKPVVASPAKDIQKWMSENARNRNKNKDRDDSPSPNKTKTRAFFGEGRNRTRRSFHCWSEDRNS